MPEFGIIQDQRVPKELTFNGLVSALDEVVANLRGRPRFIRLGCVAFHVYDEEIRKREPNAVKCGGGEIRFCNIPVRKDTRLGVWEIRSA